MKQLLCKEGWESRPVQLGKERRVGPGGASQLCVSGVWMAKRG